MATDKPRFSITFDDELFDRIEDYRHENRISTRSRAVVALVEIGLESLIEEHHELAGIMKKTVMSTKDKTLLDSFHSLNEEGEDKLIDTADDMVRSGKYKKYDPAQLGQEA